ncbi:DNA repair protein RecO [Carnobacteriaceae bacterium zg-84]|uniref:DNA repair protein RecO n=1 Tax=Granulicatella sp. zg-84 TaxID=2678503 RepID=UPI0013BF2D2D|nr:DNA repair protein RecO [Granulicatella sp. zg-84]QMI86228.1 DNA repair protein RecO [Carnobacteriaceae bacterium zg-84]
MQVHTFEGIVLSIRDYKESDAMVKIFTKEYGKQMFFVRHFKSGNHVLRGVLLPFTQATFLGTINRNGLSFLREYKDIGLFKRAQEDLYVHAYATYIVNLCDAVIDDRIVNEDLYDLLKQTLSAIEKGLDVEVVTLIFELKLLRYFGINPNLNRCMVSDEEQGPFDYSLKYGGLLAKNQWHLDTYRLQANPNAIYLLQKCQRISMDKLTSIDISDAMKKELRRIMDALYEEYVDIHLKSKTFIEQMNQWYI